MGEIRRATGHSTLGARPSGALSRATLEACANGDSRAFRAFVEAYERAVFALISRVAGKGAHVSDLAQETFLRAYRGFPKFDLDGPASPLTWLLTIAVRLAVNAKRGEARGLVRAASIDPAELSDSQTPETERARRELGEAIAKAAAELPIEQRAALVLAEFHGMSVAEIAEALEAPEATIKTRLFRARQHLRARLHAFVKEQ